MSFKPPGPGRKPRSTTWESSDIAIMLTAGSHDSYILKDIMQLIIYITMEGQWSLPIKVGIKYTFIR